MKHDKEITVSVIGGINLDIIGKSKGPLLMDNSNPGRAEINIGGVACNIAQMLSVICRKNRTASIIVKLYSAVGSGVFSKAALDKINKFGIETSNILKFRNYRTGTYISVLNENSEMVTAVSDMGIMDAINNKIIKQWETDLAESDFLAADTNLTAESLNYVCEIAEQNEIPILVEPVSVQKALKILKVQHTITYCTPNEAEYLTLSKEKPEDLEKDTLRGFPHVQNIIITRGKKDVIYFDTTAKRKKHFPVHPVYVENPNGAGDAFAAGFIYALIAGFPGSKAVEAGIDSAREALKSLQSIPEKI